MRLADITEEIRLMEQRRSRSRELAKLAEELVKSNEELTDFAIQVKELSDYEEQLRIAKNIHDGYGHAITELYTICRMCRDLKDTDPERCRKLLKDGEGICRAALSKKDEPEYESVSELFRNFAKYSVFPTELHIEGNEPPFLKEKYSLIRSILKEAYHNTLDHSLADRFIITADMNEECAVITFSDNGNYHGIFEKGFGLRTMEENVKAAAGKISFTAENGRGFSITVEWR